MAILITVLTVGCADGVADRSPHVPVASLVPLTYAEGWYAQSEWLADDSLVLAYRARGASGVPALYRATIDGDALALQLIEVPNGIDCAHARFRHPAEVDGSLMLVQECVDTPVPTYKLVALDLDSSALQLVADTVEPIFRFAWDAERGSGWYSAGSQICQGVGRVTPEGLAPSGLSALAGGQTISLDETLASLNKRDCPADARADRPAWSPAAQMLALVASPGGTGGGGPQRLDLPWTLNVYADGTGEPRALVSGIVDFQGPAWSQDGKSLVFSGFVDGQGGTWMYDLESDSLLLLANQVVLDPTFSPDGRRVFGVVSVGQLSSRPIVIALPRVRD